MLNKSHQKSMPHALLWLETCSVDRPHTHTLSSKPVRVGTLTHCGVDLRNSSKKNKYGVWKCGLLALPKVGEVPLAFLRGEDVSTYLDLGGGHLHLHVCFGSFTKTERKGQKLRKASGDTVWGHPLNTFGKYDRVMGRMLSVCTYRGQLICVSLAVAQVVDKRVLGRAPSSVWIWDCGKDMW